MSPFAATSFADERRQTLRADIGDLSGAKTVEVRDAAGQAILRGQFVVGSRRDDDNERIAALKATGTNGAATDANASALEKNGKGGRKNRNGKGEKAVARGKVEIESTTRFFGWGNKVQKVELSVRGLTAGATYNLLVDGKQIAPFGATQRGRAEIVWEGTLPR